MKKSNLGFAISVSLLCGAIGMVIAMQKISSVDDHKIFKDYTYITVEGETFETKDIVSVTSNAGYDKYSVITLKDGTVIFAEGYILRNELK